MKKLFSLFLALAILSCAAMADVDPAAMSTDELLALRDSIDREIASRAGTDGAQTVTVDGVVFRLLLAEVGAARDDLPGLGIILLASNASTSSMTPLFDLGVTVTHGGVPLAASWVKSENIRPDSVSASSQAVIRPGAVDMYVYLGYILDGEGGRVEITLSRKHTRAGEDPCCGAFVVDLPELH